MLLLVARLMVLGEISLMMDWGLAAHRQGVRGDHRPAKRRKIRRPTPSDRPTQGDPERPQPRQGTVLPRWGRTARTACSPSCNGKLKDWQDNLNSYKTLADTGNYPGSEEIDDGLTLIKPLLA